MRWEVAPIREPPGLFSLKILHACAHRPCAPTHVSDLDFGPSGALLGLIYAVFPAKPRILRGWCRLGDSNT